MTKIKKPIKAELKKKAKAQGKKRTGSGVNKKSGIVAKKKMPVVAKKKTSVVAKKKIKRTLPKKATRKIDKKIMNKTRPQPVVAIKPPEAVDPVHMTIENNPARMEEIRKLETQLASREDVRMNQENQKIKSTLVNRQGARRLFITHRHK